MASYTHPSWKTGIFYNSKLPIIGPWIGRVSYVEQILSYPCAATPEIWAKAAFFASPKLLWSLNKPDPKDDVLNRFGRGHRKRRTNILKLGAESGGTTGPKGEFQWAMWRANVIAQRLGWYMLVADAVTEFAVNWVSMAYQYAGCQFPGQPFAQARLTSPSIVGTGEGTYVLNTWEEEADFLFAAGPGGIQTTPGYSPSCSLTLQTSPNPFVPGWDAGWSAEIIDESGGGPVLGAEGRQAPDGTRTATGITDGRGQSSDAKHYRVYIHKGEGHCYFTSGTLTSYGGPPSQAILADP